MRRILVAGSLLLFGATVCAQEAPLGRLFLTPEQRAALDNARRNKIRAEATRKPRASQVARDVRVDGVVKRSDGESVVWINGKAVEDETVDGMRVAPLAGTQSSIVVRDPDKGRVLKLKVGQRADLLTGKITENYESRRVQAAQETKQQLAQDAGTAEGSRPPTALTKPRDRVEDGSPDTQAPDEGK